MNVAARIVIVVASVALGACASAPKDRSVGIATDLPLTSVEDEAHLVVDRYIDAAALTPDVALTLPRFSIAPNVAPESVTEAQRVLIANNAARSLCAELSPYFTLRADPDATTLEPRLVVTAIAPTNQGIASASAVVDVFVPGPARLPAGLGGLAVDAELIDASGAQRAVIRWARGANAITDNAQISRIGDAWQLADEFGEDFAEALRQPLGGQSPRRPRLAAAVTEANRELCSARFGSVNVGAQVAGRLIPLAPEAMDAGPPANPVDAPTAIDAVQTDAPTVRDDFEDPAPR